MCQLTRHFSPKPHTVFGVRSPRLPASPPSPGPGVGPAPGAAFEWDPAKSASNKLKHGIDFQAATAIWEDGRRIEIDVVRTGEPRQLSVGRANGKMWTAVTTRRGEAVRLISVRRSRKEEVAQYEQQRGG